MLLHTVLIGAQMKSFELSNALSSKTKREQLTPIREITSLQCMDDEGIFTVTAKTFVDASGDSNLVKMAGGRTRWGDEDGTVQAATLTFRLSGVDISQPMTPAAVEKAILQAKEEGIPYLTRERGFIQVKKDSSIVTVLLPSVMPKNLDGKELTAMEKDTRRQVLLYRYTAISDGLFDIF